MAQARVIARPEAARRPALFVSPSLQVRAATIVAALVAWEAMARSGLFYRDVIPPLAEVGAALAATLVSASFYDNLWVTFLEVIVGFSIGGVIGIACGLVLGMHPFARRCCEPYLNAIGATPKIVFLPIIFLMFGVGIGSKIAMGALSAFFPVVFVTALGVMLMSPVWLRVGRSFNLTRPQMLAKIYLPALLGPVTVGLRLGLGVAIIGTLIAEIKFSSAGLGFLLNNDYDQFQIAPMYAVMIILFALAAFANWGMTRLQARFSYGKSVSAAGDLGGAR
jgi:ABC-type nitrate/sulfonate/bicarbonate transport system permease component